MANHKGAPRYVPGFPTSFRLEAKHLDVIERAKKTYRVRSRNLALRAILEDLAADGE